MSLRSLFTLGRSNARISHRNLALFADEVVNLNPETLAEYKYQTNRLWAFLYRFALKHDDDGLIRPIFLGSLAKGTALKSMDLIDLGIYFKEDRVPSTEAQLVDYLASCIHTGCPEIASSQIQPNEHAVVIKGAVDGQNVKVIPIILTDEIKELGFHFGYGEMPVLTSSFLHGEFIEKRKKTHGEHFLQVIRLAKWWARQRTLEDDGFCLTSFTTELILAHLGESGVKFSNYATALENFFSYIVKSKLSQRISFTDYCPLLEGIFVDRNPIEILDPANEQNNVAAGYDHFQHKQLIAAAEVALDAVTEARSAATRASAIECWKQVLGPSFRG